MHNDIIADVMTLMAIETYLYIV